jgi:peptide/nickel transport system permease protein
VTVARIAAVRLLAGAGTLLAVSAAVFFAMSTLPGNAAQVALGHSATPQGIAVLTHQFGLDRPVVTQYFDWLGGLFGGNLGHSLPTGVAVSSLLGPRIGNTLFLASATMLVLIPLGLGLGVFSAMRPGRWWDHLIAGSTLALVAMPSFVLGTILIVVFAFWLHLLPAVSVVQPGKPITVTLLILPVLTILGATVAQTIRMIRASMIDVMRSPYIEMARLKGASEGRLLIRHAIPNALGPTVQILVLNIPWLIGDIVIVEALFGYQGVGTALVTAVTTRDIPTVEAIAIIIAGVVVAVNLLADLLVIVLNPKLRRGV